MTFLSIEPLTVKEVAELIAQECAKQKISQRELAEKTGFTEASISRWLHNARKIPYDGVARCFNVLGYKLVCTPLGSSATGDSNYETRTRWRDVTELPEIGSHVVAQVEYQGGLYYVTTEYREDGFRNNNIRFVKWKYFE